jgi:hypothetical protein
VILPAVHFSIYRFTTDVEELDEQAVACLIASDPDFVASLCELDALEGAIVIGDASIVDDLGSAMQRLCFEAVVALMEPSTTYAYPYFTSNTHATIVSSPDGVTIALSGNDVPTREFPRVTLLPALYACGLRYLAVLEELGRRRRASSEPDLLHLRPLAERARAALAAHGLA